MVSDEQMQYLKEVSGVTGKSISEVLRELIDEQLRAEKQSALYILLDAQDKKLLEDLCNIFGIYDVREMVSRMITVFHALSISGFWRFLKPAEEIYKMILEERTK
jgi:hypothetical protein